LVFAASTLSTRRKRKGAGLESG